jgi:hypothetical protein
LKHKEVQLKETLVLGTLKRKKKHYKAMARRLKTELKKANEREQVFLNRIHQLELERPFIKKKKSS